MVSKDKQKKVSQPSMLCQSKRLPQDGELYTNDVRLIILGYRTYKLFSPYVYIHRTNIIALNVLKFLQPFSLARLVKSLESKVKKVK